MLSRPTYPDRPNFKIQEPADLIVRDTHERALRGDTEPLTGSDQDEDDSMRRMRWVRGQEYGMETLVTDTQTQRRVELLVH
jgi:hypothetical protein